MQNVLELLDEGLSFAGIIKGYYPGLTVEDIRPCVKYAIALVAAEDITITRHGVPAGILIGFEDPEAWWEELPLRDPRFRARVAQARGSLRDGQGISIEELREKHNNESQEAEAAE